MGSSAKKVEPPRAVRVRVTDDELSVSLDDGRTITVPLAWYPRLAHASAEDRDAWTLIGGGGGIHWAAVDEDISVEALLNGRGSGESRESFEHWLARR